MNKNKKLVFTCGILLVLLVVEIIGFYIGLRPPMENTGKSSKKSLFQIKSQNQFLKKKVHDIVPYGRYIVIDSGRNRLYLKNGSRVIHEAVISCGSGAVLRNPKNARRWIFDTPRGFFTVQTKYVAPVWTKPDWAFIEEGEKIPGTLQGRMEPGVLGDYALGFGNGYYIHGTLYTRLLGRNVTHGCIRVGDEDLRTVFGAADIGTKIFIF